MSIPLKWAWVHTHQVLANIQNFETGYIDRSHGSGTHNHNAQRHKKYNRPMKGGDSLGTGHRDVS